MATVRVAAPHGLTAAEALSRLQSFEEMLKKFMVQVEWSGQRGTLKGPVSGEINVSEREVSVEIKLGMMAKMAGIDAERLQGSLTRRLSEALH